MNLSKVRLITFDVTGTLLKLRSQPGQQYGEIGSMYGIVADNTLLNENFKQQWKKMNKEHPNFGLHSGLGWENWWKDLVKNTFKSIKTPTFQFQEEKIDKMASHLIEMYKTSACWEHCYGISGLLSYLRHKKIPMGTISNFDPRLETILFNTKLKHYFDFILTSYEVNIEKPDKRIFDLAIKSSGITNLKPNECLHIGDKRLLDYLAAINAGWNAFIITDRNLDYLQEKIPKFNNEHCFSSAYQLHVNFMKKSGDKLPTPEQELY